MRPVVLSAAFLLLAACAQSPQQVADRCEREVRSTTTVAGELTMGYASDRGFVSGQEVALTAGVNLGGARDPRVAYEECVRARSGQGPVRPFGAS